MEQRKPAVSTVTPKRAMRDEWAMHWRAGLACMIGMGLGGSVTPTIFSLFILPLQQEFGWTRGQITMVFTAGIVTAILGPLVGRLIDRKGVRRPLLVGIVAMAACYAGLSMMSGSLGLYYGLYALLHWFGLAATGLSYSKAISQRFDRSRGFSLAVVRSGMAISNALLPILLFFVIDESGWRSGYAAMAALIVLFNLTTAYLWIRDPVDNRDRASRDTQSAASWTSFLLDRRTMMLCTIAMLGFAPSIAIQTQLQPLLVDRGQEGLVAAAMIGVLGASSFIGALITGVLIDRFNAIHVGICFALLSAAGCALLTSGTIGSAGLLLCIVLIGLGQGAEIDLVAYLVSRIFGHEGFSSVYGIIACALSLSVTAWSMSLAFSFEHFGTYGPFLWVVAAGYVLTVVGYVFLGRPCR